MILKAAGVTIVRDSATVQLLAELGVVFLLFDIGLHFSLAKVRQGLRDIFGFGPVRVLFGILALGGAALATGLAALPGRNRQEEVFTAMALLIALATGWATGQIGLSLTLGAFLGGMMRLCL